MLSILVSARNKGIQIATICSGEACSSAAFIFCFGDEGMRFIGEYGRIMLHGIQIYNLQNGRATEHKELIDGVVKEEAEILQTISSHLKGARKKDWLQNELLKRKNLDWYLNAKEAIDIGIANHIGIPNFLLKLTPHISVEL
jgi:ATP-dependent protease ClpP protease subunit